MHASAAGPSDLAQGRTATTAVSATRRLAYVTALLGIAALLATFVIPTAGRFMTSDVEASGEAGSLLALLNQARQNNGLAPLPAASDLTAAAQERASTMARQGALSHTPELGSNLCCWTWIGENVAYAGSVQSLNSVLINSPEHRANILNTDADDVGVAVVSSGGTLWAAEVFRARSGSTDRSSDANSSSRSDDRTAPSSSSTTSTTTTTSSTGETTTTSAPTVSRAELIRQQLREAIHAARNELRADRRKQGPFDPVRAAVQYAGTLNQVSR
jgi:uncharacterized protein YkwD